MAELALSDPDEDQVAGGVDPEPGVSRTFPVVRATAKRRHLHGSVNTTRSAGGNSIRCKYSSA